MCLAIKIRTQINDYQCFKKSPLEMGWAEMCDGGVCS